MNNLFEKIGYDEETKRVLTQVRKDTGLTNMSLVILHENTKAKNTGFLEKVNSFITNRQFGSIKEVNQFIFDNNELELPKIK